MISTSTNILLLGESDVGKTHYGAQLLRRLNLKKCALAMNGAAENIAPFEEALTQISKGLSANHTPEQTYADSVWPVSAGELVEGDLVWPDYGGEQIRKLIDTKKLPYVWRDRVINSNGWVVMVRPTRTTTPEDVVTRGAASAVDTSDDADPGSELSGQARVIELLQILIYTYSSAHPGEAIPRVVLLLSCYDELENRTAPQVYLKENMPLIEGFLRSNWPAQACSVYGLSALGQALSARDSDAEFAKTGPENHGYIINERGQESEDLTLPILQLLAQ